MDTNHRRDESKTVETDLAGYRFTYYDASGGMVVTRGMTIEDAGIVGNPGTIEETRLRALAHRWVFWREEYETVKRRNRPADMGRRSGHGRKHNRPAKGVRR